MPDPNSPGMRVCKDDLDVLDPWRLPARASERTNLRFPRPDVSVATGPIGGNQITTQNGNALYIQGIPGSSPQGDLSTASSVAPPPTTLVPLFGSISPATGSKSGGTAVTIYGSNFTDVATVRIGGTSAIFSLINTTTIIAVTPSNTVTGIADVAVFSPFGNNTAYGAFTYT